MAVWVCALWGEEWKEGTEGRDGERAGARRPAGGRGDGKCALAVFNICSRERERERERERNRKRTAWLPGQCHVLIGGE